MGVRRRYFDANSVAAPVQSSEEIVAERALLPTEASTSVEEDSALVETTESVKLHQTFTKRNVSKPFDYSSEDEELDYPVEDEKVKKYLRHKTVSTEGVKTRVAKKKYRRLQEDVVFASVQAARTELLLPEDSGFLEFEDGESAETVTQKEITQMVDIASATKYFELSLPKFGPYRIDYTRNGRYLLLGGRLGHLAAIDWFSKNLAFEVNVMESIRDVQWLHNELLLAVAQKRWVHVYDNHGTEVHVIKQLHDILRLEFLPYHLLLVASSARSFLNWVDVSIGKMVKTVYVKRGRLDVMCQNPMNAIIHCGHPRGTVTLWSPNSDKALVNMLCHTTTIKGISVDPTGTYMATSGVESKVKIWDLRMYKELHAFKVPVPVSCLAFSQKSVLATGAGRYVKAYRNACNSSPDRPYLIHNCREAVHDLRFCPFEDVLGVGHQGGFASLLMPGAGEPNVDAFESNPYQSASQRREAEVHLLLDKIQPEMITLDSAVLGRIDRERLKENGVEQEVSFKPGRMSRKTVTKGNKSSIEQLKHKKALKEEQMRERIQERRLKKKSATSLVKPKKDKTRLASEDEISNPLAVLDRFRSKHKK